MFRWMKLLGLKGQVKPYQDDSHKGLTMKPKYASEPMPTMKAIIHAEQESIVKAERAKTAKTHAVSKAEIIPFLD